MSVGGARHLVSVADLGDGELRHLVERGVEIARDRATVERARPLAGRVVGVYFRRTSTRTRSAFTAGAQRLGASTIAYGPDDLQENTGESAADTGRVLSGMLDTLVARTTGTTAELRAFADQPRMSVVNAMSAREHPTQALADLTTILAHVGRVEGTTVRYVGEGNNTAVALALALTRFPGTTLHLNTPSGYGLPAEVLAEATRWASASGATLTVHEDMTPCPGADVVYTTRWQTTGTEKPDADWRSRFDPFRVDDAVMAEQPGALFMHDLPAHRGEEVTASVLDGARSIAFDQATNKLHSAMAVLEWCAGDR
ncbi:ornithine carbamoyltransferase [Modestobacter sp. Leaf380]|uniref:ornithine carbamoyltransferase n=1 Tax=Modestobacter sp. Leaf380 TaxID=1736356 RepID=UPI0006F845B0|nr:ornithine carbamoyltransferase [Modestobacter sp. Leaf380]KQS71310.1 ornithine carbamoyltransferase [Modestobacter sp. Leaf380]